MRFFTILDLQHWIVGVALGLILLLAIYLAWRGYPHDREHIDDPFLESETGFVPESDHHRVTPLLIFIYAGVAAWVLGYMIIIGIFGGPIY